MFGGSLGHEHEWNCFDSQAGRMSVTFTRHVLEWDGFYVTNWIKIELESESCSRYVNILSYKSCKKSSFVFAKQAY